jgi:ABC-type dipeptide/oligopeptide/nickel transport system permease component
MEELANVNWDEKKQRLVDLLEPIAVAYLYVIAVMSPILGLILGIVMLKQCVLEKNKRVGKICVIISIVMFGVFVLCIVLYILLYAFIFAAILGSGGNFS